MVVWWMIKRVLLHVHHVLDPLVMVFEVVVCDRPGFVTAACTVLFEPLRVFPNENVGVDERTTTQAAGDDCSRPLERPDIEHPIETLTRAPKVSPHIIRRAWKGIGWVRLATLQQADPPSRFCQSVRHHRPAEARANDDRVKMFVVHGAVPFSMISGGRFFVRP